MHNLLTLFFDPGTCNIYSSPKACAEAMWLEWACTAAVHGAGHWAPLGTTGNHWAPVGHMTGVFKVELAYHIST